MFLKVDQDKILYFLMLSYEFPFYLFLYISLLIKILGCIIITNVLHLVPYLIASICSCIYFIMNFII